MRQVVIQRDSQNGAEHAGRDVVLFVDDEREVLERLCLVLRREAFRVVGVESAQAALEYLEGNGNVRVVVSDEVMPGMTGTELLRRIASLRPETVRILLTGFARSGIGSDRPGDRTIHRVVNKPCPTSTLRGLLLEALAHVDRPT